MKSKNTIFKSVGIILLSLCCFLSLLAGCSPKTNVSVVQTTEETSSTDAVKSNDPYVSDLPSKLNYNDEVTLIARNAAGVSDEFYSEGVSDSTIDSAVYRRCSAVEERLGVSLNISLVEDNANDTHYTIIRKLENNMAAGDANYDLVAAPLYTMISYQLKGTFADLNKLDYLDLNKSYWAQNANEGLSVGPAQYLATGAATLSIYRFMYVTVINSDFLKSRQFSDNVIYNAVKDGEWTLDYQTEIAKDLYSDLNGDSKRDVADSYGFVSGARTSVDAYWASTASTVIGKDMGNYYSYAASIERISGMVDKVLELFYDYEGSYIIPASKDGPDNALILDLFNRGKTAMATMMINSIESGMVGTADFLYEIAPIPKYNETQSNYYTHVQDQVTSMAVPSNVGAERRAMLGAVLESLAEEGYRYLYSAYFERVLPYRYLQSPESKEMLQLIYESVHFGMMEQSMAVSGITPLLRDIIASEVNMVSSKMASAAKNAPDEVQAVNDAYRELYRKMNG